ncbi:XrtA/PEP-CTERM system TPR-repeat protein PrsT [Halorhodospira halophila]|uniref:XrtA/PEP-CTERM system TPR-repeat protein PrsT n=1 Tax=Halorhodospira halophila TaxID=1053 RepID=UPI001911D62E|nr:XrtA/PEP-CTERM system TPR-repeat protein PrsT [Halorhodospira halophila]
MAWRKGGWRTMAAAGVLTLGLAGCEGIGTVSEAEYLERAERHLEGGRYESAVIEYRNALQQNPAPETRALLGVAYLGQGRLDAAAGHLMRSLEDGVDPDRYSIDTGRLLLELGRPAEIARLPRPTPEADDEARWQALLALGAFAQGDTLAGRDLLQRAEDAASSDEPAELALAYAYAALYAGDPVSAQAAVDRVLAGDSRFATAWALQGDLAHWRGEREAAAEAYQRAIDLRPARVIERYKRVMVLIEDGQLDEAEAAARDLTERASAYPGGHFALGLVHFERGQALEARPHLEQALARHRNFRPAMPYLAALHIQSGNFSQAEHHLERFAAAGGHTAMSYGLLAELRVAQGRPEEAREILRRAVAERPGLMDAFAPVLAALYLDTGETERGIDTLTRAMENRPEAPALQQLLGVALLRYGEPGQVRGLLGPAAGEDAEGIEAALARQRLEDGRFADALALGQAVRDQAPDRSQGYTLVGAAHLGMGQEEEALAAFADGLRRIPGNPALGMNLAMLQLQRGEVEAARSALLEVQEHHPGHPESALQLARMESEVGGDEAAGRDWLERAVAGHPEALEPHLVLARHHLRAGAPEKAGAVLDAARDHHPARPELLFARADVFERAGDYRAAVAAFERLIDAVPDHSAAHFRVARNLNRLGELDAAEAHMRAWLDRAPEDGRARHVLGSMLIAAERFAAAEAIYREQVAREGRDTVALHNLAWLLREADPEEAVGYAEQAAALAPGAANVMETYGTLLYRLADHERAAEVLGRARELAPDAPRIGVQLARTYQALGDLDRAEGLLRGVLEEHAEFPARAEAEALLESLGSAG